MSSWQQLPSRNGHAKLVDASALVATVGAAALCWALAVRWMSGMAMGVDTRLGSFSFFVAIWVSMMAAMMLPGALPAALRAARDRGRIAAAPLFVGSYLAVWAFVGLLVYVLYQPHSTTAAGALTIGAALYELTPFKRTCRWRCRAKSSGLRFGLSCVGSSAGLMLLLLGIGAMNIAWMSVVAVIVVAQKLLQPRLLIDVPVAFAILGLGVAMIVAPSLVPGLMPSM
jgi:predicted metal-binding membrane protein